MDLSEFVNTILTIQNLFIMVASSALLQTVNKVFPKQCRQQWYVRIQPLLPMLLCSVFVWLPGARPDEAIGPRIFVGLILGMTSSTVYKIFKQSIMKKDTRIT